MNKFKGIRALDKLRRAAALLIVFALLLSAVFIVAYASHDCNGEDCRICEQVQICLHNFNLIFAAAAAFAAAFAFGFVKVIISGAGECFSQTPITLKVKLLN
jgi:hypothetical protein